MLVLLTVAGCYPAPQAAPQAMPLRTVEVLELRSEAVVDAVRPIGRIEPWREVTLYFEVPGVVEKVLVEEGALVEAGQPIAALGPLDFELAVSRAIAQHDAAQAKLDLLLAGTRSEDLQAAQADHAGARVRAAFWVSELKRNRELVAKGIVTPSLFEQIQREHDATQQQEVATKARLARAIAGPRKEEIATARADVMAFEHETALAKRQLEKATLTAPFRGRVEKRFVDEGAYVNVFPTGGVPVIHLVDLDQLDAVIAVPEASLPQLAAASRVEIVAGVDPNIRAVGETVSLGKVADPGTGTYELRVRFPDPEGRFTGGMVVIAEITHETSRHALRTPVNAVLHAYGQPPYVLTIDGDNQVAVRQVRLGPLHGEQVEIADGLSEGELLIVRGQHHVVEGDRVEVRAAAGPLDATESRAAP